MPDEKKSRYHWSVSNLIYEEDVAAMFKLAAGNYERVLLSLLWLTGARPSELLELAREDIAYDASSLTLRLKTLKLGENKKNHPTHRVLKFKRPSGLDSNIYMETIINHIKVMQPEGQVLPYGRRWIALVVHRLAIRATNHEISPYHFRHSVLTHMAAAHATIDELKHFKGAATIDSIMVYMESREQYIDLEIQRRARNMEAKAP